MRGPVGTGLKGITLPDDFPTLEPVIRGQVGRQLRPVARSHDLNGSEPVCYGAEDLGYRPAGARPDTLPIPTAASASASIV